MLKYFLVVVFALIGVSVADAQQPYRVHPPHRVQTIVRHPAHQGFTVVNRHYHFGFRHRPAVVLYGNFAQYQQFNVAVVGYTNLAAMQAHCGQLGLQIVEVNPIQGFVVVRFPVNYGWNNIVTFSNFGGVRFIEPGFRRY